jgi:S1-C subfamily serine protease
MKKLLLVYTITILSIVALMIIKLPEYHYTYIRNEVSAQVVKITNEEQTHGGTGFHIRTPKGAVYIMTNAHVCEVQVNGIVTVTDEDGNSMPRRVVEQSRYSDLCLVEPMPGKSGLKVGKEPHIGEIVAVIGHPLLMPTTVSRGEIIGKEEVDVKLRSINESSDKCNLPKNRIEIGFFGADCMLHITAYLSNVIILPGNSGSPAVDFYGHVVAVAFAGSSYSHWGMLVTLKDINKFLEVY